MTQGMDQQEMLADRRVTYTLEMDGRFFVVENVPARVNVDTGEQLFSPQTVERLQRMIRDGGQPVRMMETPVYKFVG
jgi:hypothetical protein